MADLDRYLDRIGFRGTPRPDVGTLTALHRRHLLAIPYENLDVQLGVPVSLDVEPIYDKLVLERRGGWCYEMNGLLAWALETIGFPLTRLAAGVWREVRGDDAVGNHLALRVQPEDDESAYLADVGFGDGILEPIPLRRGQFKQASFEFSLEQVDADWWRFHNHPHGGARTFDFTLQPADAELLARQCRFLQTSPESPFTQVAVVQRHVPGGLAVLRGRVLTRIGAGGIERRELSSPAELDQVLLDVFDLTLPDTSALWRRVEAQHAAFLERLVAARQRN